jgi:formamidopyrimidine-DNA glycosylase
MPELPEVEILVRHLGPLLKNRTIRDVEVRRKRVIAPNSESELRKALRGATFVGLTRRGKYLLFSLQSSDHDKPVTLLGHLGMTGRMFLMDSAATASKHTAVVLNLGKHRFVFEDTRYFGRLTLDIKAIARLGPEPLGPEFTAKYLSAELKRSSQAIKVKLLDQSLVAGVGNIYASEALFCAGISPRVAARRLKPFQVERLCESIRKVLDRAIDLGDTLPLDFSGNDTGDRLFYYGSDGAEPGLHEERFSVYDRAGLPCGVCQTPIRRIVQAARSTFFCPECQR